jgi:hypothetical protein
MTSEPTHTILVRAEAAPEQWTREKVEEVWDVFARVGLELDRASMYHDEGADSEFCARHRRVLAETLDRAQLVPVSESERLRDALLKLAGLVLTDHEADERGYLNYDTEYEGVIRDRASLAQRLLDELGLERPQSPYGAKA